MELVGGERPLLRFGVGNVPPEKNPAMKLAFPAATVGGQVAECEISAVGAGGSRYDTRICAIRPLAAPI